MTKARIHYIDILKAFAIILIFFGHIGFNWSIVKDVIPSEISLYVFSINVVLFWLASGFFLKPTSKWSLKKEARSILLPYAVTALLAVIITAIVVFVLGDPTTVGSGAWDVFMAAVYGTGSRSDVTLFPVSAIGGIWFLLALFWGKLAWSLAHKTKYASAIIIVIFLVGWYSSRYVFLPFSIQPGLCASLFLHVGYLCNKHGLFEDKKIPIPIWITFPIIWITTIWWFGDSVGVYPVGCAYPHGLSDAVGAICGCLCVVPLAKFIDKHLGQFGNFMQFVGRNTLVLFCMHILIIDRFPVETLAYGITSSTGIPPIVGFLVIQLLVPIAMSALIYLLPRPLARIYFPQKQTRLKQAV